MPRLKVSLLDYGAGNVRSVRNAILANGYELEDITDPSQIASASVIVFPGVGAFSSAMQVLRKKGYVEPLKKYLAEGRPYLGICLGMQTLFESSEESHEDGSTDPLPGLGVVPGRVIKFDETKVGAVPHIGWNGRIKHQESPVFSYVGEDEEVYFVHSYYAPIAGDNEDWILTSTTYGGEKYISAVQKGCVVATQFHPEKSGKTGLNFIKGFLEVSSYWLNVLFPRSTRACTYILQCMCVRFVHMCRCSAQQISVLLGFKAHHADVLYYIKCIPGYGKWYPR